MKRIALLAAPLLAVGLLAGCGDDSGEGSGDGGDVADAPTNATVEEFCQPFVDLIADVSAQGEEITDADAVRIAKETADKLEETGTPEDMPEDARKGFELILEKLAELPDDATKDDVSRFTELTEEEQKYSDALTAYITEKCADQMMESMTGDAS